MTPRVSVVVTTYNGSRYIGETIDAILAQSFTDFELLIIDDASTDDTVAIVEDYTDPRIRLVRNPENLGISRTRNRGIELARGDYLAANDHDDLSLPERLACQVAYLDAHPKVVLLGTGTRVLENGVISDYVPPITQPHVMHWALYTRSRLVHSSICLRVGTLRKHQIRYRPEFRYAEDFELFHRCAQVGQVVSLPRRLAIYREYGHNNSSQHKPEMVANGERILLELYRELLGDGVTPADISRLWRLTMFGQPARDRAELLAVGEFLAQALAAFLARARLPAAEADEVRAFAAREWWQVVKVAAKSLGPGALRCYRLPLGLATVTPPVMEVGKTLAQAALGPKLNRLLRGNGR